MSETGILIIHIDRETQQYKKFEIYPNKFKDKILPRVEEWNDNKNNTTLCKIYNDPLLVEMAGDSQSSWSRENLISSLRSIARDIDDSIDNLNSWNESIDSELNYDEKYQQALQSIRSIAEECLVSSKIPPEKIESIINECSEALNE